MGNKGFELTLSVCLLSVVKRGVEVPVSKAELEALSGLRLVMSCFPFIHEEQRHWVQILFYIHK